MKLDVKSKKEENSSKDVPEKKEKSAAFLRVRAVTVSIKNFFVHQWRTRPVVFTTISALVLDFLIEILCARSIAGGAANIISNPLIYLYNSAILFAFLSFSLLFRKRFFVFFLISIIWLGLAITNCVLLGFRTTPLSAIDFSIFITVVPIVRYYLKIWQVILIALGILALINAIVRLGIKCPKEKLPLAKRILPFIISSAIVAWVTITSSDTGVLPEQFTNIANAYKDYGFVYCFSRSVIDRGIDEPDDYDKELVDDIVSEIEENDKDIIPHSSVKPNIIFLQLESFFDPKHLKNYEYSEDPTPVFTALKNEYPSGYLTVPVFGAGTANIEFEVLTGMNVMFFGAGEYPYKTVLTDKTIESVCYNLKEFGYHTTAIHNNTAVFYGRDIVFANLGFDNFISIENMAGVEYNEIGWAKDSCLTNEIMKTLTTTDTLDLIYTITVQGHGRYPSDAEYEKIISVDGVNEDMEEQLSFEYYLNQVREDDEFIGDLTKALSNYDEPVVLVMFGDHLPNFEFSADDLDNGSIFQTEYIIWSNFDLHVDDKDLSSYQLSAYVTGLFGLDSGVIASLHRTLSDDDNYLEMLETLMYDMIYGEGDVFEGENPYKPTNLVYGIGDYKITGARRFADKVYITGAGFTESSVVYINNLKQDTTFINENTLMIPSRRYKDGCTIVVKQLCANGHALNITKPYYVDIAR